MPQGTLFAHSIVPENRPAASNSPVSLRRGASRSKSPATRFEVLTFDAHGNQRRCGGAPLRVGIAPRACHSGDYGSVLGIVDRGDGTHEVTYVAGLSGRYRVSVTILGAHVDGSPFTVDVPLEAAAPDVRSRSPTATLRLKTAPDWW